MAVMPAVKSASRPASTTCGSGAWGWVSCAVTKIACGTASAAGTRLNGRVRRAPHRPLSSSTARTTAESVGTRPGDGRLSNDTWVSGPSSAATSMTIETKARRSPRWTALTVPVAGEV